jgi:hypothetical protein
VTTYKISREAYRDGLLTCVVWDLDSVVADTRHRHWMLDGIRADPPTASWEDYSLAGADDEPIRGTVRTMRLLAGQHRQAVITGRSDAAAQLTIGWFARHDIPVDELRMRPAHDNTENGIFKVAEIKAIQEDGYEVVLVGEDWAPSAARIEAELDIPVLGITPFYEYGSDAPKPEGAVLWWPREEICSTAGMTCCWRTARSATAWPRGRQPGSAPSARLPAAGSRLASKAGARAAGIPSSRVS